MKVSDILQIKGYNVFTEIETSTIRQAISVLVNNNIGVLLIVNSDGNLAGIVSERDILKAAHNLPLEFYDMMVKDIMTQKLIIVEPEDDLNYVENVMTENHIRHLPVINKGQLTGLISIGDIVKHQLSHSRSENKYLMDYIAGV